MKHEFEWIHINDKGPAMCVEVEFNPTLTHNNAFAPYNYEENADLGINQTSIRFLSVATDIIENDPILADAYCKGYIEASIGWDKFMKLIEEKVHEYVSENNLWDISTFAEQKSYRDMSDWRDV